MNAETQELIGCLRACMAEIDNEIEQRKFSGNDEDWAALQSLYERSQAAIAALPAVAPGVKPLVWEDVDAICTRQKAAALGGHYSVVEFDAGTDEAHYAANIDLGGLAFVFILEPDPLGGRRPKRFPTLDAAKAAAQADYEARILAALTALAEQNASFWTANLRLQRERDALAAQVAELEQECDRIHNEQHKQKNRAEAAEAKVARLEGAAEWQEKQRRDAFARRHLNAPEDPHVYVLCERYGYGAVMDAASRLWARKDSMGAFYIGGCIGIKPDAQKVEADRDD
jgi:hypothetical protein